MHDRHYHDLPILARRHAGELSTRINPDGPEELSTRLRASRLHLADRDRSHHLGHPSWAMLIALAAHKRDDGPRRQLNPENIGQNERKAPRGVAIDPRAAHEVERDVHQHPDTYGGVGTSREGRPARHRLKTADRRQSHRADGLAAVSCVHDRYADAGRPPVQYKRACGSTPRKFSSPSPTQRKQPASPARWSTLSSMSIPTRRSSIARGRTVVT